MIIPSPLVPRLDSAASFRCTLLASLLGELSRKRLRGRRGGLCQLEKDKSGRSPHYFLPLKFCLTLSHPHITRKEIPMEQIPDDPIIAAMLRTGWPPWMLTAGADDDGLDQD